MFGMFSFLNLFIGMGWPIYLYNITRDDLERIENHWKVSYDDPNGTVKVLFFTRRSLSIAVVALLDVPGDVAGTAACDK